MVSGAQLSIIMTVFNRRAVTLRCLNELRSQLSDLDGWRWEVIVVDDASPDGTGAAIADEMPEFRVIQTPGDLYWAAGMALAEQSIQLGDSYILWLNDDVSLFPGSLARLLGEMQAKEPGILIGGMRGAHGGTTYSGLRLRAKRPTSLYKMQVTEDFMPVDAFNGNLVCISPQARIQIGAIDGNFGHAYADLDYGLRARKLEIKMLLAPGFFGICELNSNKGTWRDDGLPLIRRLRLLTTRKGIPPADHYRYLRHHGGLLWPMWFLLSYANALADIITSFLQARWAARGAVTP